MKNSKRSTIVIKVGKHIRSNHSKPLLTSDRELKYHR